MSSALSGLEIFVGARSQGVARLALRCRMFPLQGKGKSRVVRVDASAYEGAQTARLAPGSVYVLGVILEFGSQVPVLQAVVAHLISADVMMFSTVVRLISSKADHTKEK